MPDKERECLTYVGIAEESMVTGMQFEVPKEYAGMPQLLVSHPYLVRVAVARSIMLSGHMYCVQIVM